MLRCSMFEGWLNQAWIGLCDYAIDSSLPDASNGRDVEPCAVPCYVLMCACSCLCWRCNWVEAGECPGSFASGQRSKNSTQQEFSFLCRTVEVRSPVARFTKMSPCRMQDSNPLSWTYSCDFVLCSLNVTAEEPSSALLSFWMQRKRTL